MDYLSSLFPVLEVLLKLLYMDLLLKYLIFSSHHYDMFVYIIMYRSLASSETSI